VYWATTLFAIGILYLIGCATVIKGGYGDIDVKSDPRRAEVFVDGELVGETPITVDLRTNQTHIIEFKKEGFETKTYILHHHLGAGWLVLDLLFWPSLIVDAITGDWYTFDEYEVSVKLEKEK
jgi:hypothetical protein